MTISNGLSIHNLTIYPPNQPIMENLQCLEFPYENEDWEEPMLPSDHSWSLKEHTM